MNITNNQFEILAFAERENRENNENPGVGRISTETRLPAELVKGICSDFENDGVLEQDSKGGYKVTERGLETLEPYRVKRAVILAAGFGSRMVPITLNTPKPLVRVHGKMIIETLLDAIEKAEIPEIVLIRGYLWEQFDQLKYKYPNIKFIENHLYNKANNISSALIAKDLLENAYVCEADLLVSNPHLIRKYEYRSNYLGQYKDYTDDWCFKVENSVIKELLVGSENCYHMYGISYWTQEDGKKMSNDIEKVYNMEGGTEKYWDEVALRFCMDNYEIYVRPCFEGDIVEIDTFGELQQIDESYKI